MLLWETEWDRKRERKPTLEIASAKGVETWIYSVSNIFLFVLWLKHKSILTQKTEREMKIDYFPFLSSKISRHKNSPTLYFSQKIFHKVKTQECLYPHTKKNKKCFTCFRCQQMNNKNSTNLRDANLYQHTYSNLIKGKCNHNWCNHQLQ